MIYESSRKYVMMAVVSMIWLLSTNVSAQSVEAQALDANINTQTFTTTSLSTTTIGQPKWWSKTTHTVNKTPPVDIINDGLTVGMKTDYSSDTPPFAGCIQKLFRISGYYSPLPSQNVYTRDTYEAELRLNGRGVNGASWAPVYNGMVAAPKSYAFGTVIVIPGLGVGEVKDRGGAIVANEWYDRIDIWLGHGDAGIHRAKSIGMRRAVGRSCPEAATAQIGFNTSVIPHYADFTRVAFWSIDQYIGRSWPLVTMLQSYLTQLGYLSIDTIPSVYNEQMRQLMCRFQQNQLWLNGDEDYCGNFGPKTRAQLKQLLTKAKLLPASNSIYQLTNSESITSLFTRSNTRPARNYQVELTLVNTSASPTSMPKVKLVDTSKTTTASIKIDFTATSTTFTEAMELWLESDQVVVLQKILMKEWLFDHRITWYFGPITQAALTQYQLKYGLIDSVYHLAAWHIWPATRTHLNRKQVVKRIIKPLDQ